MTHPAAIVAPRPIRLLAPLVASQIAAGEVVERPASVVKELVENAIDAGAAFVSIELEQGGIELVRVSDDGHGIPGAELPLALAPHATSKVSRVEDLDRIATLGFRGEALASIASVSRLSIRSRVAGADEAFLIEAEGLGAAGDAAQAPRIEPAAGAVGTVVTVRTLFFNTPARRKFLKTVTTEQGRCLDVVRDLALAHPGLGFRLSAEGRSLLDVPPRQDTHGRALAILGKELREHLLVCSVDQYDDARGVAMWGLVGTPEIARATRQAQYVFVNGRAIRDKTIQHAVQHAYRGLIEPARFPTAVLMLELSPEAVDVNVHPQKAEVRFRDSGLVHSTVYHAVQRALRAADLTPVVSESTFSGFNGRAVLPSVPMTGAVNADVPPDPRATTAAFVEYFRRLESGQLPLTAQVDAKSSSAQSPSTDTPRPVSSGAAVSDTPDIVILASVPSSVTPEKLPSADEPGQTWAAPGPPVRPVERVLQVHNSYLVTQDEQGVLIVDQHALHERVMFEALLARIAAGPLESQQLLAPVVVDAPAERVGRLSEITDLLVRIGINARPIGPQQIAVDAFPTFLFERGIEPGPFLNDLFCLIDSGEIDLDPRAGSTGTERALRDVLDMMACKAAVKAGDHLSVGELTELLRLRSAVERSSNCPHGRPTSVRLTIPQLERLFGRS